LTILIDIPCQCITTSIHSGNNNEQGVVAAGLAIALDLSLGFDFAQPNDAQ
jgi:hypothetical protein